MFAEADMFRMAIATVFSKDGSAMFEKARREQMNAD